MLAEHQRELLTAFIDGEMTRRQRKTVLRLLHRSSEARAFLRLLQEDAHRLRSLPRVRLEGDLASEVLQLIQERTLPAGQPVVVGRPVLRRWRSWATAAAVLLVLGTGVGYFAPWARRASQPPPPQASQKPSSLPKTVMPEPKPLNTLVARMAEGAIYRFVEPIPDPGLQLALQDLQKETEQKRLAKELQRETAFHFEVTVVDHGRAVDRIKESLQKSGVQVLVDQAVLADLKKEQAEVLVYIENVRPEEVTRILRDFGTGPGAGQVVAPPQEKEPNLVVEALSREHRRHLSNLLDVDVAQLPPPRKGPAPLFDPPPIAGPKNQRPKEGSKEPPASLSPPRAEPTALVLVNRPAGRPGALSPEIRAFLAKRHHHLPPGTLQIMVVLHQARA